MQPSVGIDDEREKKLKENAKKERDVSNVLKS